LFDLECVAASNQSRRFYCAAWFMPRHIFIANLLKKGVIMMDVIGDIYQKSIQPSNRSIRKDKKYIKAKNQKKQCYQRLYEKLSEKDRATLNKLMSCYNTQIERKNVHCFKTGFKTGVAVAVKSLD
jgi:uncharacterized protein (UPF0305 family)